MTQQISDFNLAWKDLCHRVAKGKLRLPDETPRPTPEDVAGAVLASWMADAREQYRRRFADLYDLLIPHALRADDRPDLFPDLDDKSAPAGWEYAGRADGLRIGGLPVQDYLMAGDEIDERLSLGMQRLHAAILFPDDVPETTPTDVLADGLEAAHAIWELAADFRPAGAKNPLAALIEAWLQRPEEIRPAVDKSGRPHRNGILPAGLFPNPPASMAPQRGQLLPSDQLPALGRIEPEPANLPLFAEMMDEEDLPVTPLILANAAGFRGLQPGRGARLDKRVLIFSLLEMPLDQRRPGGRYELIRPLRFWRDLLWPKRNGKSSYRPAKHREALYNALTAVNLAEIVLPDGGSWVPVARRGIPRLDSLDSEVVIQIELPGGSERGPLIDRTSLTAAGVLSDPAFDLELGLAYLWDEAKMRNGGHRIYATRPEVLRNEEGYVVDAAGQVIIERGRPSTRWNHPSAVLTGRQERNPQVDKVRVLTREDRRRLAYGPGKALRGMPTQDISFLNQKTNERAGADRRLAQLEAAGRLVIERNVIDPRTGKKGWRILEAWPLE